MNENVYLRENFKDDSVKYKTEERVRKVWCVVVYYTNDSAYTYYVDSTTGEIIGGNKGDEFASENILKNDPSNLIEK